MRHVFIACYDIADPRRLKRVFNLMKRYGTHVQLSVFICRLSETRMSELIRSLNMEIEEDEDQVLLFPMGSEKRFEDVDISAVGKPFVIDRRKSIII